MSLRSLINAGALMTTGMMIGRVLGLLREMLLASRFGIGEQADMAIAFLIIPDFIGAALIGSAASAALVPAFFAREREDAVALFWQVMMISVAAFVIIALAILLCFD